MDGLVLTNEILRFAKLLSRPHAAPLGYLFSWQFALDPELVRVDGEEVALADPFLF